MNRRISFMIFITLIILSACNPGQDRTQYTAKDLKEHKGLIEYKINIVDLNNHTLIEKAYVAIPEIKKKYFITPSSNKILLTPLVYNDAGKYPYGFSMISYAEGYLPRIDHGIMAATGTINIELKKLPKEPSNEAYTEYFHGAAMNEVAGFLDYYKQLPAEK